ncbi:hypothetical protein D3C77_485720 [compost metagenome]
MTRMITKIFGLPENTDQRKKFSDGVEALAAECGVTNLGGSMHNELNYVEKLEKELEERIGQLAVEDLRQTFERSERNKRKVKT